MKIVIVHASDSGGGAERIASTLASGLREKGHQVAFFCAQAHLHSSRAIMGKFDWVLGRIIKRIGYADAVSLAAIRFLQYPEVRAADVIHFHNLHGFYFGIKMLPKIIAAKPCVWTLHDCWAISGGCYSHLGCEKWRVDCRECPCHGIHPMTGLFDTAAPMLRLKRAAFRAMSDHGGVVTGVSRWMTIRIRQAFEAADIDTRPIHCLPNFVDISAGENGPHRLLAQLSPGRPIVLLVAADINNRNKGMRTALRALQANLDVDFALVTVGEPFPEEVLDEFCLADRTVQLGRVENRAELAAVYGMAKVTLVPSMAESFCLVAAESIACGTPVIASDVAALPDMVLPGVTGFLSRVNDVEDFARNLRLVFATNIEDYSRLSNSCKEFARQQFISFTDWGDSYLGLYRQAIESHK